MIYNNRSWSNSTIESQKEKSRFNVHFQYSQSKIKGLSKMCSLKSLFMLKCNGRTSSHAVQNK